MRLISRDDCLYRKVLYDNKDHYVSFIRRAIANALPSFLALAADMVAEAPDGTRAKPDLVLVDRDYAVWYVVEVELSTHSLRHHVLPQVRTLAAAHYGEEHAQALLEQNSALAIDPAKLTKLVTRVHPEIVVIVNDSDVLNEGWSVFQKEDLAHLMFIEVFRDPEGFQGTLASWSGFEPCTSSGDRTSARPHPMLNALVIEKPASLIDPSVDELSMEFKNAHIRWKVLHTRDQVLLQPLARIDLRKHPSYRIDRSSQGYFRLSLNRT